MIVKIIGSHGGVSPGFRATSFLIDGTLLIDAGSVASGIPVNEQVLVDYILISHSHLDHISDLAYISDNCFGMRSKPFDVRCHTPVKKAIKDHFFNDLIWPDFTKIPNKNNPTMTIKDFQPEETFNLGPYHICPVKVNHDAGAVGFIIQKDDKAIVFTQDTGPTERIWEVAKSYKNIVAVFTEVSFPNRLEEVAKLSYHHTPNSFEAEMKKIPSDVPIFVHHLKPGFCDELKKEIADIGSDRITVLESDNSIFSL